MKMMKIVIVNVKSNVLYIDFQKHLDLNVNVITLVMKIDVIPKKNQNKIRILNKIKTLRMIEKIYISTLKLHKKLELMKH